MLTLVMQMDKKKFLDVEKQKEIEQCVVDVENENEENAIQEECEEYAIHNEYYQILRNVLLFLIGFGAPLNGWLKPTDKYALFFQKYPNLWFYYKVYCWLLVHIGLVLNLSSVIYLLVWMNKDFSEMCQLIVQFIWNVSSAVALDECYANRNSELLYGTCKKHYPVLLNLDKEYPKPYIQYQWHMKFIKYFYNFHATSRLQFFRVFIFAIIFNVYLYFELIFNFASLDIEKLLNMFMFVNIFIVSINILSYMAFCLVFRNKFRLLNVYINILIENKDTCMEKLQIISKWYKHNYSKVLKFDNTFNLFIVTFYISITFNVIISLYGIVLQSHVKSITSLVLYNILYYSFIAFNTFLGILYAYVAFRSASDVNVVSDKSKKLIEKYVTCTKYENRSIDFNIEYQHFHTTYFSKPVHLTLFGLGSITKMSFGVALISILPYIPNIIEFTIKNPLPVNENDFNNYIEGFVNETIEEFEHR